MIKFKCQTHNIHANKVKIIEKKLSTKTWETNKAKSVLTYQGTVKNCLRSQSLSVCLSTFFQNIYS